MRIDEKEWRTEEMVRKKKHRGKMLLNEERNMCVKTRAIPLCVTDFTQSLAIVHRTSFCLVLLNILRSFACLLAHQVAVCLFHVGMRIRQAALSKGSEQEGCVDGFHKILPFPFTCSIFLRALSVSLPPFLLFHFHSLTLTLFPHSHYLFVMRCAAIVFCCCRC